MPADAASLTGMALAALCCAATAGPSPATAPVAVTADHPATLCLVDVTPAAMPRRAVLVLTAYRPQGEAGGRLTVAADTGETTLIGMFPGGPFEAADPASARRYLLPGGPDSRCWTIGIDGEGTANIFLEPAAAPGE